MHQPARFTSPTVRWLCMVAAIGTTSLIVASQLGMAHMYASADEPVTAAAESRAVLLSQAAAASQVER